MAGLSAWEGSIQHSATCQHADQGQGEYPLGNRERPLIIARPGTYRARALVAGISEAGGAALVVFLHELRELVQGSADHLVPVAEVFDPLAGGPVEHPLVDFPVLPLRDIDEFGGTIRMPYHVLWAEYLLREGLEVRGAVRTARHVRWPERQLDGEHVVVRVICQPPGVTRRNASEMMRHISRVFRPTLSMRTTGSVVGGGC